MSRRARAVAFAGCAMVCAALAASLAGDYRGGVEAQLGELRPVVVAAEEVPRGRSLTPAVARRLLEVREVPARFAPADALTDPLQAVGGSPAATIPPGSYVTVAHLRPERAPRRSPGVSAGEEAVEIAVAGAGALAAGGAAERAYDVVATTEPGPGGGDGKTRVVAENVRLLALDDGAAAAGEPAAGQPAWTATVAATRSQALRVIHAHNFAREVRLIAAARGG